MRNVILLLLLLLGPLVARAQESNDLRFKTQRTVVYPVSSSGRLDNAVKWYADFFGMPYDTLRKDVPNPYAVFIVDGTEVRLETDPKYLKLNDPLFYWVLPTPEAVNAKFKALKGNNRISRMRHHGGIRQYEQRTDGKTSKEEVVKEVRGFIVYDPEDNQVGVINNPIYKPRK
ncbi:hypothetical protein [Hymenobacter lapidiphilus]|uniref:VOC family protein n=1 Tax=Hymenobacter lapidiphilus TaxID=2608003 RepID=A0A7Y7U6G9_9BACT|nr:hypothetical protein [Hymenobacter lapidiphilus]NVO32382.1 hypothetical protein [Hymenobacter lapidiphilus]